MADLKFTECEIRQSPGDIQNGGLTDYMFMMYRKGEDGWYKNSIFPVTRFLGVSALFGAANGICVYEDVRITSDKNGKAAFTKADIVFESLNRKGKSLGLPEADPVYGGFALRELIKIEKQFLKDDGMLVARLTLTAADPGCSFPVTSALFTITLRYFDKDIGGGQSVVTEVCPLISQTPGTAMYGAAEYSSRAAAEAMGYDNALWLDCVYNKYITGISGQNIFFRIGDSIVTPPEKGGIMFETVKALMTEWGLSPQIRKVSSDELVTEIAAGNLIEVFGVDDVFGILPVTLMCIDDKETALSPGKLSKKLYDSIINIERGVLLFPACKTERI